MLSKSSAKAFFLIGTGLCAGAFLLLTLDTFQKIPQQTNNSNLNPQVIQGKHLWESNNCMGCHTILGEGAYYAPELTKVYERRGASFIRSMLTDPEAMYPGQRKMVKYNFTDEEKESLIAFFKWIGEIDLNGFPAKPTMGMTNVSTASTGQIERPVVFNQVCTTCHALAGQGGAIGPALDGVGGRRDSEYLKKWLLNPTEIKADSKMPKLPLSETDVASLVNFLSQLK